jgi:MOSC domain-containing protein YiiM
MEVPVVIGQVLSVNVGRPRTVEWHGRQVKSGIWKEPVAGPIGVQGVNLDGDDQADRRVHGGPDKAVYAYAIEDYRWWSSELGRALHPATFGENLTTEGVDLSAAIVGDRWLVGSATLEVCQPRFPCYKLGIRMGDDDFVDRFEAVGRLGAYLRILDPGAVTAGDRVVLTHRPAADLTIGDMIEVDRAPTADLLERVAASAHVPQRWRERAARELERQQVQ